MKVKAIGWVLLVVGIASAAPWGFGLWQGQQEQWRQARERLSRLKGWLALEEEVAARKNELLGPLAQAQGNDLHWAALQAIEEAAQARGVSLTQLRPFQAPALAGKPVMLRLDAKVEGDLGQVSGFLQHLPDALPGVRLDNLQLMPQRESQVQGLLRLYLPSSSAKARKSS